MSIPVWFAFVFSQNNKSPVTCVLGVKPPFFLALSCIAVDVIHM
jgi:hypothetical protein